LFNQEIKQTSILWKWFRCPWNKRSVLRSAFKQLLSVLLTTDVQFGPNEMSVATPHNLKHLLLASQ